MERLGGDSSCLTARSVAMLSGDSRGAEPSVTAETVGLKMAIEDGPEEREASEASEAADEELTVVRFS